MSASGSLKSTLALLIGIGLRSALADDVLHVGSAHLDRPTLVTLGMQLLVSGDDDFDAHVAVRYRTVGSVPWRDGMPLYRVHPETVVGHTVPAQFAGSVFDLAPATAYEIELHATDPDGPIDQIVLLAATTRAVPTDPAAPTLRPVADGVGLRTALASAQPGDVISLAPGTYAGTFELDASGTATKPIVIRGASDDTVVLDGQGTSGNLFEIHGSFVHIERLTAQNALRGLRFKAVGAEGNVVRRVRLRHVGLGIIGDPDQRDFYLCDNVLEGKLAWPQIYANDGGTHANDDGINVQGDGHVVCHNRIAGFGDAMKVEQDGARGDDFYGNEILSAYDNGIELDGSEGNTRAFRNRFTNTFVPLSFQPIFGGPAYALRNVVANTVEDQLKFYARGPGEEPNGVVVLHNTFVSPNRALEMASPATGHDVQIENNLFVGPSGTGSPVVYWAGVIDRGTIDWNGWAPDGSFDFGPTGTWGSFAAMQTAGVVEAHGRLLTGSIFENGLAPATSYKDAQVPPDARLALGSNAIDGGRTVANIDDTFSGAAPDLGALETGCTVPIYGPRPEGIDESNAPTGCGGPPNTAETTVPIQTTSLKLSDHSAPPANPAARKLRFKSKTSGEPIANRILVPAAGGAGDPTLHGATVTIYNAAGDSQQTIIALPAAAWSILGVPLAPRGYRYRAGAPGAISKVSLQRDRITLTGGGASFDYGLAAPSQGRVALRLQFGGQPPWCAAAPARRIGNPASTAASDKLDLFVTHPKTPGPIICPPVP